MVDVTWHGHACVGLRTARGAVVMDPFSPQIGLQPLHVAADIVVTSHPNPTWHSYLPAVADPWLVLDGLVPLATGLLGSCPLYTLLGLNTCPVKAR